MTTTLAKRLTVLNSHGIYCRPAALLVKAARQIGPHTDVTVKYGAGFADGWSVMAWLTIEGIQGRQLLVEARGPEAREVLEALANLFNCGFMSGEACLPIPPTHSETIELPDPEPASPGMMQKKDTG